MITVTCVLHMLPMHDAQIYARTPLWTQTWHQRRRVSNNSDKQIHTGFSISNGTQIHPDQSDINFQQLRVKIYRLVSCIHWSKINHVLRNQSSEWWLTQYSNNQPKAQEMNEPCAKSENGSDKGKRLIRPYFTPLTQYTAYELMDFRKSPVEGNCVWDIYI